MFFCRPPRPPRQAGPVRSSRRVWSRRKLTALQLVLWLLLLGCPTTWAGSVDQAQSLSSLQSYTGLLMMPNARVLPDWRIRFGHGNNAPYRYYGGAIGIFDRFELFGQFTEVTSLEAFPGEGYGNYKDRASGAKIVLLPEGDFWPQVTIGAFDATGTALFSQRYIVASKMLGDFDLTFGLGQGSLAGEFTGGSTDAVTGIADNAGNTFLTSSPFRATSAFGGVEWHATPSLSVVAEYDSIDYSQMFGFEETTLGQTGNTRTDNRKVPVNVGLKYKLNRNVLLQGSLMGGNTVAFGVSSAFDMEPEGMLVWKKPEPYVADERMRWQAYEADNKELGELIGREVKAQGFRNVGVAVSDDALWIEAENSVSLSPARAIGRMSAVAKELAPERIRNFYLNLTVRGQVLQSLKCDRGNLEHYVNSRLDQEGFFLVSELDLYGSRHWDEFSGLAGATELTEVSDKWWRLRVVPRLRTFVNNRKGFFKHKGVVQFSFGVTPWELASLVTTYELTFLNQYNELEYPPLEDEPTRTDLVKYEERSGPIFSQLAFDQVVKLPYDVLGRGAVGYFERGYAGFGGEVFRYFADGRFGAGLESEVVWKRDIEDPFEIDSRFNDPLYTGFVNLWANIWPREGLEGSLKIGRFLAGDKGVSMQLQRTYNYFTLGGWYTYTNTDVFTSDKNRGTSEAGVFIRIPLSIFASSDVRGAFSYSITSFTRDQGATVAQPNWLMPSDSTDTPLFIRDHFGDIRSR